MFIHNTSLNAKQVPCDRKLDFQDQTQIIQCDKHQSQCISARLWIDLKLSH